MANEQNLKPFKPGNLANPNGRPKKFVSFVIDELKQAGYENVKRSQIVDIYELLLSLPQHKLVEMGSDDNCPMIYRIIAKEMLGRRGFDVIEKMIDRAQGRALDVNANLNIDADAGFSELVRMMKEDIDETNKEDEENIGT